MTSAAGEPIPSSPRRARRFLRAYLRRGGLLRTKVVEQVITFYDHQRDLRRARPIG
jgi:hypothetical protein